MGQPILQQVESQNKQGGIYGNGRSGRVSRGSYKPRYFPRCGLAYQRQLVPVLPRIRKKSTLTGNAQTTDVARGLRTRFTSTVCRLNVQVPGFWYGTV